MIRLHIIATFAVALLLWSVEVSGQMPESSDATLVLAQNSCNDSCCLPQCPLGPHKSCLVHGHGCNYGLGQRLGVHSRSGSAPAPAMTVPMPVEPPPHGFMEGLLMPQQYQQVQPMAAGYGYQGGTYEQRIVYVPYAAPPPIYVERLGKALPRPPVLRRILGDANMYEYPEMPLRTYTTRGPRDFLAPHPPGIGY